MRESHNGNFYVLLIFIFSTLTGMISPVIYNVLASLSIYNAASLLVVTTLIFHLLAIASYYFRFKIYDKSYTLNTLKSEVNIKKVPIKTLLYSFLIGIGIQPAAMVLSALGTLFSKNNVSNVMVEIVSLPFYQVFIAIALIPAIMEEIGLRGIVLSNYTNFSAAKSAIITGLLFAFIHGDLQQLLYTFLLGTVFAYMVKITGSILPTIITHMTVNASQIFISYCNFSEGTFPSFIEGFGKVLTNLIVSPVAIALSIYLIYQIVQFYYKNCENKEDLRLLFNYEQESSEAYSVANNVRKNSKIADPYFIAVVVIYVFTIILNYIV